MTVIDFTPVDAIHIIIPFIMSTIGWIIMACVIVYMYGLWKTENIEKKYKKTKNVLDKIKSN